MRFLKCARMWSCRARPEDETAPQEGQGNVPSPCIRRCLVSTCSPTRVSSQM